MRPRRTAIVTRLPVETRTNRGRRNVRPGHTLAIRQMLVERPVGVAERTFIQRCRGTDPLAFFKVRKVRRIGLNPRDDCDDDLLALLSHVRVAEEEAKSPPVADVWDLGLRGGVLF